MHLKAVRIPLALRGFESDARTFDVVLEGGQVAQVAPNDAPASGTLISCPVDAHVHLDKNFVIDRVGPARGDLMTAIDMMASERDRWSEHDIFTRMDAGVAQAHAAGTRAMRTHLDWTPTLARRPRVADAFERVQREWAGRMHLQAASLTPLDFFDGEPRCANDAESSTVGGSERLGLELATLGAALGAFVYRNTHMRDKLQRVFDLAIQHQLLLDFHVDEGLDADACGLRVIAELTESNDMHGRVTCGHACSLSVQSEEQAGATLRLCEEAGLHLVALPTTNAYLQGSWTCTPIERGITRLSEAAALGIRPCIATDNVQDAFFPYGSYDLLDTFALGVQLAHLHPADEWLAAITTHPARALNLPWDGRIAQGCPADVVLLAARTAYDVVTPQGRQRRVWRSGVEMRTT